MPGKALINRPVRMPKRPVMDTPWYRNPGATRKLCLETTTNLDYPDVFLLEDDTNGENYLTQEY